MSLEEITNLNYDERIALRDVRTAAFELSSYLPHGIYGAVAIKRAYMKACADFVGTPFRQAIEQMGEQEADLFERMLMAKRDKVKQVQGTLFIP